MTKHNDAKKTGGYYAIRIWPWLKLALFTNFLSLNPGLDRDSLMNAGSLRYQMVRS